MGEDVDEHAVRLREDASGWRQVDGPRLDQDDPFITGLDEDEADALVRSNWALRPADVEAAREFYEGTAATEPDPPFDPAEFSVDELEDELASADYSAGELDALADAEADGKDRTTALEAIEDARDAEGA